jgi:hypothetical protein
MSTCDLPIPESPIRQSDVLAARLGATGAVPPITLLGVTRLAIPGRPVELEATAVAWTGPPIPYVEGARR